MICPYCDSENPDGAAVCSSCNAVLAAHAQQSASPGMNGATSSFGPGSNGGAGGPYAPGPYGSAAFPAPGPNGSEAAKKGKRKWVLPVVLGVVALVVVAIVVVSLVTCSASSRLNLNSLTKDEPAKAAEFVKDFEVEKLYGYAYYMPEGTKELMKKANAAFMDGSRNAIGKVADDIKEQKPWAIAFFEEDKNETEEHGGKEYRSYKNLKLKDLEGKGDPCGALYLTYRVLDDPTPEDVLAIVREVSDIDELTIGLDPTYEGKKFYEDQTLYYFGVYEGSDACATVRVNRLDDVYEIILRVYNTDEMTDDSPWLIDYFNERSEEYFESTETVTAKK